MLGVNQGIIMVLAVVVIGGLVGSPGSATRSRRVSRAPTSDSACSPRSRSWHSESHSTASRGVRRAQLGAEP